MEQFGTPATQVVLGRPVHFSGADNEADEKLALRRLTAAAELAGFPQICQNSSRSPLLTSMRHNSIAMDSFSSETLAAARATSHLLVLDQVEKRPVKSCPRHFGRRNRRRHFR